MRQHLFALTALFLGAWLASSSALAEPCTYFHTDEKTLFEGFSFFPNGDVKYEVGGFPVQSGYRYRYESDGRVIVPNDKNYFALVPDDQDASLVGEDVWLKGKVYRPRKGGPYHCDNSFDLFAYLKTAQPEPASCYRQANEMRLGRQVPEARRKAKECCFETQEPKVCNFYGVLGLFTNDKAERLDALKAFNMACQAGDKNACDNLKLVRP